jgi:pilus assembly protein CpaD
MWSTDPAARVRVSAIALLAAAAMAGCAPISASQAGPSLTPTEQYSVQIKEAPDQLALTAHAEGMSMTQRAAVVALVSRWRASPGAGDFAVQTPAGDNGDAEARTSADVQAALHNLGVPSERIRTGDYPAPAGAPVLASYVRLEARGPDCEGGWDNLTSTGSNRPSTHFGCAVTANFAAMVADPRDLLAPAPDAPADGGRRNTVLGKYRAGEATSTPRDEQAAGAISRAVN